MFCFCEPEIIRSLCRYWRQAADTFPDLWSNINCIPRPELMGLFLNRSGARPLEVCGHPLVRTTVPSLELLYISDVHGDSPDSYSADWVPQLLARSIQAPRLQCLCLGRILLVSPPRASLSPELGYLRWWRWCLVILTSEISCFPGAWEQLDSPYGRPLLSLSSPCTSSGGPAFNRYLQQHRYPRRHGSPYIPHRSSIFDVSKVGLDSMRDHDFEMQITDPPPSIGIEFSTPRHAREHHAGCVPNTQHPCAYAAGNFEPTPTIVVSASCCTSSYKSLIIWRPSRPDPRKVSPSAS